VSSTYSRARALENYGVDLGIGQVGPHLTPYALADDFSMKVVLTMVLKSLEAGRNAETVQYDTIRQLHTRVLEYVPCQHLSVGHDYLY
jgi:hypothetical protein